MKKRLAKRKFYQVNHYIRAPKVRVVDETGKQVGVLSLGEALKKAGEAGLDLVEVAPYAKPPVAKIIDFKKFKYLEAKKQKEERKKSKKGEMKELRFSPFIAKKDFEFRLLRAEKFLKEGHKVKITVRFFGRQITRKEFGYDLLKKLVGELAPFSVVDQEPKFVGRQLTMTLTPAEGSKNDKKKAKNKKVNQEKV
ncbi:MAG TPA: translation initiation factor IF-3 [Candidatus Bathyarchaeia archaeon]|nr:translation initiation factor IF-3 [Candidatus Bathyarchaeia archaeon]